MKWQLRLAIILMCVMAADLCAVAQYTPPAKDSSAPVVANSTDTIKPAAIPVKQFPVLKPKKPKLPVKEISGGPRLTTDGWALFVEKGWSKGEDEKNIDRFYNARVVMIDFSEHKHPKELKQANSGGAAANYEKAKPYVYGKINNFYSLKFGYGNRKMIAGKPEQNTVSVHWVYTGGLSIGLLKPYYIDAYVLQDNSTRRAKESIKYTDETEESFLAQQYIVGPSGWSKGLGETKIAPGIFAKTGLHFDFAKSLKSKLAFEVGLCGELYTQKIQILAMQDAFPYLFNGYISVQLGKRY